MLLPCSHTYFSLDDKRNRFKTRRMIAHVYNNKQCHWHKQFVNWWVDNGKTDFSSEEISFATICKHFYFFNYYFLKKGDWISCAMQMEPHKGNKMPEDAISILKTALAGKISPSKTEGKSFFSRKKVSSSTSSNMHIKTQR